MTARYFAILTNYGAAQLANAVALGTQMNISAMAVGDGGGTLPVPDPAQTKLVRETRRAAVNQVSIDEKNPNFIIAEQVIPENEGGWWIREIGLFDDTGGLIAVGNAPETYKSNLQEGSGRTQVIQMVLMVSSTQAITLKVDPSVVLATREYVTKSIDAAIQESETKAARIYATKTELSSGLSGKQPTGDYATRTELNNGLSGKQPTGDYATKTEVNSKLAKDKNGADIPNKDTFIKNLGLGEAAKSNVVQTIGSSTTNVMSQDVTTRGLLAKVNKTDVTDSTGADSEKIISQKGVTDELNKKLNKNEVLQNVGTSTTQVMSQDASTRLFSLKTDLPKLPLIGNGASRGGVTASRELGITYTNDKPYSIFVTVMLQSTSRDSNLITRMRINDTPASNFYIGTRGSDMDILAEATHSQLILPRERYVITSSPNSKIVSWVEIAA
ncbi:phage tail protein [Morganella morganii]|nr:phage tail protein [Morganella morganii]WPU18724.1 phage tail protein [Morganella morganii]